MSIVDQMMNAWNQVESWWASVPFPLQLLVLALLYLVLLLVTLRLFRVTLNRYKDRMTVTTYQTLYSLTRMLIIILFVVAFFNQFPQFEGSLIGLSALLGTAIGFASTQTVGNFISGLYIMIARPFYVGDYVVLPRLGVEGIIQDITVNYTKVFQPNGTTALISNRSLIDTQIINMRYEIEELKEKKPENEDKERKSGDAKRTLDLDKLDDQFREFFTKLKSKKKVLYIYPLQFEVDVNVRQQAVIDAINKLERELEAEMVYDLAWRVIGRNRLAVQYELNVAVEDPVTLLKIRTAVYNKLELLLEETLL